MPDAGTGAVGERRAFDLIGGGCGSPEEACGEKRGLRHGIQDVGDSEDEAPYRIAGRRPRRAALAHTVLDSPLPLCNRFHPISNGLPNATLAPPGRTVLQSNSRSTR